MKKKLTLLLPVVLGAVVLDQVTKLLVLKLMTLGQSIPIIPSVINLTYIQNRGAAFGMLSNHRWVFMVLSTLVMFAIIFVIIKFKKYFHPLMIVGLSFTVGGGIGNMIDRTVLGYVVDFIDFTLINFAVFNIADTFICIGVGLLVLDILLKKSDLSFLDGKKPENEENDNDL